MGIDSQHPLYEAHIEQWQRCRDTYLGEDAVKDRGETYLPKIDPGQDGREYSAYLKRALFYEAVSRTVEGFVGAISRKPAVLTLPGKMADFEENATGDGRGLAEMIRLLAGETLLTGRVGILVDWDEEQDRSCLVVYPAEQITNWGEFGIVLAETAYEADPDDPFRVKAVDQFRQLAIVDGRYTVTIWRRKDGVLAGEWAVYEVRTPQKRGRAFDALPWVWLTPAGTTSRIVKPPLMGLVNTSLSHYRSSADLEHGRHFTGMPTLYVTGIVGGEPIRVGAATAILLQEPSAKVGFAEFTGAGLGSLETALEDKERMMAVLGAAIFGPPRKGVEAAETARIRSSAETSLLMTIVSATEEAVEEALEIAADWMGVSGECDVDINRDFLDTPLDPATLAALVKGFQAGAISEEVFLHNLRAGELLPPEMDIDAEAKALRSAATKRETKDAGKAPTDPVDDPE